MLLVRLRAALELRQNWGFLIQLWAALLLPRIPEQQAREGDPDLYNGLDVLARRLHERRLARGGTTLDIAGKSDEWLDEVIRRATSRLELLNEAESGHIPTAPPGTQSDAVVDFPAV